MTENGGAGDCMPLPMDSVEALEDFLPPDASPGNGTGTVTPEFKSESWCKRFWRWIPTSEVLLENAERKVLSYIRTQYEGLMVDLGAVEAPIKCRLFSGCTKAEDRKIWTLIFNAQAKKIPLVVIHGLCASAGLWALNMDSLAEDRTVYAIDLLGFGRSSRPRFSSDAAEAEQQHVEAIEAWRKKMNLDKFMLLGHSMGGFLSAAYALKYPDRVSHLVLADPWGMPKKPEDLSEVFPDRLLKSRRAKLITTVGQKVNALAVVRAAGPYGPGLIGRARPDLVMKFEALNQDGAASVSEYIYHCNAQNPTGEEAFRTMMDFFGWAKNPIQNRLKDMKASLPLTLIYGGSTWLQQIPEDQLKQLRPEGAPTKVYTIPEAGHHVYADNQPMFNEIVHNVGNLADQLG